MTKSKRLLAILLALCLMLGVLSAYAFADEQGGSDDETTGTQQEEPEPSSDEEQGDGDGDGDGDNDSGGMNQADTVITAFAPLDEAIRWQGFDAGDVTQADIVLPDTLEATVEEVAPLTVEGVAWACTDPDTGFDAEAEGIYTFTAELPDGYALADGVALPQITVIVRPEGGMTIMPLSISTVQVGDYVHFGKYDDEEILWQVTGVGGNIELLSVYVLWDAQYHNDDTDTTLTYASSDIKAALDAFIADTDNFTVSEQGQISAYGLAPIDSTPYHRNGDPATCWTATEVSRLAGYARVRRIDDTGNGAWVSVAETHGVRPAITIGSQSKYDSPQITGLTLSDSEFDKSAGRSDPLTVTVTGENARAGDVLKLELYAGQNAVTPIEYTLTAADITGSDFTHAFTVAATNLQSLPVGGYTITAILSRTAGTVETVLHTYSEVNAYRIYMEGEEYIAPNGEAGATTVISMGGEDWYVIRMDGDTSWTLLRKDVTGATTQFGTNRNYSGSDLQLAMDGLYPGNFSPEEQAAIAAVNLTDINPSVSGANLWPLSDQEADKVSQSLLAATGDWWLRSPGNSASNAAVVFSDGTIFLDGNSVSNLTGIRPAFQLNLSSFIFTSDASSGADAPQSSLTRFRAAATPQNLKLTLSNGQDDLNGFSVVNPGSIGKETDENVPIDYTYTTGAAGGEFLRVRLTQGGKIMYTGVIAANLSASGGTVDLPLDGVEPGVYDAEIYVEQAGGSGMSNTASKPVAFELTVTGDSNTTGNGNTGNSGGTGAASGGSSSRSDRRFSGTTAAPATGKSTVDIEHLGGYRFRVDKPLLGFASASVDGDLLVKGQDYTVRSGSTVLTLSDSYVASLKTGSHTLRMEFLSATATVDFTVTPTGTGSNDVGEPNAPALTSSTNDTMNPSTGGLEATGSIAVLLAVVGLWAVVPRKTCK